MDGRNERSHRPKPWWLCFRHLLSDAFIGYDRGQWTETVPVQWLSGKSRLEATIDLNDFGITDKPIVLFEQDRPCTFDDGRITDAFTADGAHVYRVDGR